MTNSPPPADKSTATAKSGGLFSRLAKTRRNLTQGIAELLGGANAKDTASLDDLHDHLLLADVGVDAGERIINRLRRPANAAQSNLHAALRDALIDILAPCEQPLQIAPAKPFVVLMVGVNGTGKTTTLAKIAAQLQAEGKQVMLAACDTFRAAAIEQLQAWGKQLDIPVIAQSHGADAAAVAFDAHQAACARDVEVLLIDTAGRQHTHDDLMAQLQKVKRVLQKVDAALPHETLLTVDAGNGYNALSQVSHFNDAVGVDGLCVTKLDGTAKGGVVVALAERFALPVRYIGVGQEAHDLRAFRADEFVAALLPDEAGASSADVS